MATLNGKIILVLSPQSWGKMLVSKHHYSIEVAKAGNRVYFLNPPLRARATRLAIHEPIVIRLSGLAETLFIIDHRLPFPYRLKFRLMPLFHWLMKFHVKKILKKIGEPIDIVWSFDLNNLYPLKFFHSTLKIFHPVDEPLNAHAIKSAVGADIIFSVTREILAKYDSSPASKHFINHGVADRFLMPPSEVVRKQDGTHVGFSGNLLRNDIDRQALLIILDENPEVIFNFWGSYDLKQGNIGGAMDPLTVSFIDALKARKNARLHGAISSEALAVALHSMDAFLICYDVQKDQSKGTNYHKVMEYLSTGKIIVTNNITTYANMPGLMEMVEERTDNKKLLALFKKVIGHLGEYNSELLRKKRVEFARENSYTKQISRIEAILDTLTMK